MSWSSVTIFGNCCQYHHRQKIWIVSVVISPVVFYISYFISERKRNVRTRSSNLTLGRPFCVNDLTIWHLIGVKRQLIFEFQPCEFYWRLHNHLNLLPSLDSGCERGVSLLQLGPKGSFSSHGFSSGSS